MPEQPELFLIAHKVRGAPAFDIASQIEVEGEVWWIVPTSGHRAYPILHWPLAELEHSDGIDYDHGPSVLVEAGPLTNHPDWASLEDHYPIVRAPDAPKPSAAGLLAALGLGKPKAPTIARRL